MFYFDESNQDVRSKADLEAAARAHLDSRAWLQETYDNDADEHRRQGEETASSGYVRPDYLHLRFLTLRLDRAVQNGSKRDYLVSQVFDSVTASPGDCVFQLIHDTSPETRTVHSARRCLKSVLDA